MAYLHCHKCSWQQDDFWSESYNPMQCLKDWTADLLRKDIDEPFTNDADFVRRNGNISRREVIARECERAANTIRSMRWRTWEEFKRENPDRKCPECGAELDCD